MKTMHPISNMRRQAGITLIELMISLLLSLLLVAGMIQVFAGNRATYEFTQGLSRIQENARFSLDHIAFNARMAGYSGCLSDVAYYNNLDVPTNFRDDIENGIQGYDASNTGDGDVVALVKTPGASGNPAAWTPSLPPEFFNEVDVVPDSDVLVVRGIASNAQQLITPFSDATQLYVPATHGFVDGEVLIVSDCQKASLFQLTQSGPSGLGENLLHSDAGAFAPGNAAAAWGPEQEFGLGAEVARLETHAFYVGPGANGPSLFQLRLLPSATFAAEELVEGVETLQIRYGIDPDNDGAIDNWVPASAVADWTRVLSLEVTLLARSIEEYGSEVDTGVYDVGGPQFNPPANDRRLRQVFSSTIGVRNRLP